MIMMRHGTREGQYHLRFKVYDRKHTQTDISANVTVTVKEISPEAVLNAGSIRIAGITDEDFIRIWNYRVNNYMVHHFDQGINTFPSVSVYFRHKAWSGVKLINSKINW
jgi:hypothetical protein